MQIKRRRLMQGAVAIGAGAAAVQDAAADNDERRTRRKTTVVLVHGGWHGAWCYQLLTRELIARDLVPIAVDLPGHGLRARFPASYFRRPLDPQAFATEVSPQANVTLDDYVDAVLETIDAAIGAGSGSVMLVGHSMSGGAITAVAERAPEKIAKLVYLCAFMPAPGVPMGEYVLSPENAGQKVTPQFLADPATVGALRIDQNSSDAAYRARTKEAFCHDVPNETFDAVANLLIPDVPAQPFGVPTVATQKNWGRIKRAYIRCTGDQAIRPALQDRFIREADYFTRTKTEVATLDTSHSPFMSAPAALADVLANFAR